MNYKLFGKTTGLFVSEVALGTGMFGIRSGYGSEPEEAKKIFTLYADAGGNFIDTSDAYQSGEAEELLGNFMGDDRKRFVIASKYSRGLAEKPAMGLLGNHRKAIREGVEASLKRLKTDYIDLYFAHFEDKVTPIEELLRGMEDLVTAGKILYTGLSNFPAWRVAAGAVTAQLKGWTTLTAIQIEYSLLQRIPDKEFMPMAEALGMGVMGYSPMAGGVLTGKYRKGEKGRMTMMPSSQKEENERQQTILNCLTQMATEMNVTMGQLAIAWVKQKGVLPILGARTTAHLNDNLGAISIVLTAEQIAVLEEASVLPAEYPHNINTNDMMKSNHQFNLSFPSQHIL